ncbi:polyprenyl synthetase family protein [candidate division KSB1 bacterium]|nr:polyprenyl synthetase family protein [candidate division KSB1 bacterium]TDI85842.1 MAG: polyprenyl synthetase family protein [Caldithrix sp.]
MSLKEICKPIKRDLEDYEQEFKRILKSNVFLIDKVIQYIIANKGKRLRPILVILTSRLHNGNGAVLEKRNLKAAAIMELLHTATLVHDDVVDGSNQRRGVPSVNSIWKNKVSVLMGDYLFSKALLAMLSLKSMRAYQIISETAERMAQGELLGVERRKDYWMEEEVYFRLIGDKTASLLAAACQLGAVSSSDDEEDIVAMKDFGENLGLAFQIRDDLLDILGKEKKTGKPLGNDIRDNKVTLPLIFALRQAKRGEARRIIRMMKRNAKRREIQEIVSFVEYHGGIDYAMKKANGYLELAEKSLERYPDTPYKDSLTKLVSFVTTRES